MQDESKLLWCSAQECQLQVCELMSSAKPCIGSSNLSYRGNWHALLCQTDLGAQIWPFLPSQSVALLRCRQVIGDFTWNATVVWFGVPSRFSQLDTSCTRLLRLPNGKSGCCSNQEPVNSPLPVIHFRNGNLALRCFIAFSQRVPRPPLT